MVIHHLCMITRRMRTCDHLIDHLRYMGWATKYRLKSFGTTTPGITRWECHPAPRQMQVQMMRALPPQTQEEVGWDGEQHILGAILKSIPYSKPCGKIGTIEFKQESKLIHFFIAKVPWIKTIWKFGANVGIESYSSMSPHPKRYSLRGAWQGIQPGNATSAIYKWFMIIYISG